jgi:hypothetical protein
MRVWAQRLSVYVDDMRAPFRRIMIMCHMTADTPEELRAMANRIGIPQKWCQYPGTWKEHFDICLTKRKLAVTAGAVEITMRELVQKEIERRDATGYVHKTRAPPPPAPPKKELLT